MSTMLYDINTSFVDFEVNSFSNTNTYNLDWTNEMSSGQDAQYILRKKAILLDLWNLIPPLSQADVRTSFAPELEVAPALPVINTKLFVNDSVNAKEWFPPLQ